MSEILISGMSLGDFATKCGGSTFLLDGELFTLHRVQEEEESYYDDEGDVVREPARIDGAIINSRGRWESVTEDDLEKFASRSFDFTFPACGYVNHKKFAYYIQRNVERQWKIGYHSRNVLFKNFFDKEVSKFEVGYSTSDGVFMLDLFNPQYYDWQHALDLVESGEVINAAINHHVCIGRSLYFSDPVLVYKNIPIGYFRDNKWYLFETASYVQKILPFNCNIKEDITDVVIRSEWD